MDTETVRIIFAVAFCGFVVFAVLLMLFVRAENIRFRNWDKP
jgi:hypothetical protein